MFSCRVLWFQAFFQVFNTFWISFCVWCKIAVSFPSFVCGYPVFPVPFIDETVLSPLCVLPWFVNKLTIYVWIFFSGLSVLFHWTVYLYFMPILCCLIIMPLWYSLDRGVWCFQFCFSFSRLLWLFSVFSGSIQILGLFVQFFCEKFCWNFDSDCIESVDGFG